MQTGEQVWECPHCQRRYVALCRITGAWHHCKAQTAPRGREGRVVAFERVAG